MSDIPDDIQLRLSHASDHAETLKHQLARFPTNDFTTLTEVEAEGLRHVYKIYKLKKTPRYWPLVLGDFLHDMRSALDNMAYAFAAQTHDPLPDQIERRIAFPITDSVGEYRNKARNLAADAGQPFADYVESVQPYGGLTSVHAALWQLQRLNNVDKHRKVSVVHISIQSQQIIRPDSILKESSYTLMGSVEDGAEIARFTFHRPRSQPYFEPRPTLAIGVPLGGELTILLDAISTKVTQIVRGAPW
ncbi:MAG TPA: hypothetical protein VHB69_09205 [Mycobacteriales bacterium]|nr:hypothetical protein [Mycobacteriales bacterium]